MIHLCSRPISRRTSAAAFPPLKNETRSLSVDDSPFFSGLRLARSTSLVLCVGNLTGGVVAKYKSSFPSLV